MIRKVLGLTVITLLAACSSNVKMSESATPYVYAGEKYGVIKIAMADRINNDANKSIRVDQLYLDSNIKSFLMSKGLYDSDSKNSIEVLIDKIHIRNSFNAVMFGFMSGSDNLGGTVTLKSADNNVLANFSVAASYALGGSGGGQNDARLGWLSEEFAKLTVNSIAGIEKKKSKKKKN